MFGRIMVYWEVFDYKFNLLTSNWLLRSSFFFHYTVLIGFIFLGVYPFLLSCPTLNIKLSIVSFLVLFSSVTQSCPTLCDYMNRSTPGLPVHHHLPEFTQTHVHRVSDAIQPSHPLSSLSPPALNPSQHQSLFQ